MSAATPLSELAELSSTQHGYVTRSQAHRTGISDVELVRITKRGNLERVEHGIYRFRGAGLLRWESVLIAWLRLDPEHSAFERTRNPTEVVAGATAAWIYEIGNLDPEPHEFITAARRQTRRSGIRLRQGSVARDEREIVKGIPVTRPKRIIEDLFRQHTDVGHITDLAIDATRRGLLSNAELMKVRQFAPSPDGFVDDVQASSSR